MKAKYLKSDDVPHGIESPTWNQVVESISKLGEGTRSSVVISVSDDHYDVANFMGIGGGEDGKYTCFVVDNDGTEFSLVNPEVESNETVLVYAGQPTLKRLKEIVDAPTVLLAAKTYCDTGSLDTRLSWIDLLSHTSPDSFSMLNPISE